MPSEDLIKLYKISDIFLFPSVIESFGIVIIEAMAAALPVIACKVPGSKDLVKDNKNGFLVRKNNVQEFVKRIVSLYNNKKLFKRLKKNSFDSAQKFDWEKISNNYIKLYEKIIKETKINKITK